MVFIKLAFKKIPLKPAIAFLAILFFLPDATGHTQENSADDKTLSIGILSDKDKDLYARIFDQQENGNWAEADKLIAQLSDRILLGHIRFQRYMHPTKYRSTFSELSRWMSDYADQPGANRIYRLARKRQGNARRPNRPEPVVNGNGYSNGSTPQPPAKTTIRRNKTDRSALARFDKRFDREIFRNRPGRAEKRLWAFEKREILTPDEFIKNLTTLAENYFFTGNDSKAYALASLAVEQSSKNLTQANWIAAMAAWRLGACTNSAWHFAFLAEGGTSDRWIQSASAFWAARSYLRCKKPEEVTKFLQIAATNKDTFYGLIAMRQLGIDPDFYWGDLPLTEDDYNTLYKLDHVKRAIALAEAGNYTLADQELRLVWTRKQHLKPENIIALAARLDLPATQVLIARDIKAEAMPDSHLFPVPLWEPDGGYTVDRALFFGFMRQESHFLPRARSSAGAMGLMQLMPSTASFIAKDRSLRWSSKYKLLEPEINMTISQTYMQELLSYDVTEGNLFKFATAYNGGPGNLGRWSNRIDYNDDPLLFIETIPYRETRNFIEKVLANFWIYRLQFGQATPSLDAVASGAWPVYEPLDKEIQLVYDAPAGASSTPPQESSENAGN